MERLTKCTLDNADELAKPILQEIKSRYGMIPNFYSALGINGAVMKGYLEFEANLEEHSLLSLAQREMISLAVANYNGCEYCVSGHSFPGNVPDSAPMPASRRSRARPITAKTSCCWTSPWRCCNTEASYRTPC